MSNKSSVTPAQDHDINKLILEKKNKENQVKNEAELKRQRKIVNEELWPYLLLNDKSITEVKQLLSKTKNALQEAYKQKMTEEQNRLSGATLAELDVDERLERDKKYEMERIVLSRLQNERIGTALAILEALEVVIIGKEAEENSKRALHVLNIAL